MWGAGTQGREPRATVPTPPGARTVQSRGQGCGTAHGNKHLNAENKVSLSKLPPSLPKQRTSLAQRRPRAASCLCPAVQTPASTRSEGRSQEPAVPSSIPTVLKPLRDKTQCPEKTPQDRTACGGQGTRGRERPGVQLHPDWPFPEPHFLPVPMGTPGAGSLQGHLSLQEAVPKPSLPPPYERPA